MKKKLRPIKWFRMVEGSNWADNYAVYTMSIKCPGSNYRPVNAKYCRQRSRWVIPWNTFSQYRF